MEIRLLFVIVVASCAAFVACDKKKPAPAPPQATGSEPDAAVNAAPSSTIKAYPLGYKPPDAGADAGLVLRTGVCSYTDSGYDGQDSKYTERMLVKVKDEVIVAAEYRYRGGYAIDGKSDKLNIPLRQKVWLPFELPMTSGTQKFSVRFRGTVDMDFKGVAEKDASGECIWEKAEEVDSDKKDGAADEKEKKGAKKKR